LIGVHGVFVGSKAFSGIVVFGFVLDLAQLVEKESENDQLLPLLSA